MGTVYEAENTWTRRRVAVKVMHPEVAVGAEAARRFRQEAQSAALLGHPNIVEVLDMGQDATTGRLFIVQEFLTGRDLARHLRAAGRMAPAAARAVVEPVMEALVTAHAHGIIHRDLKPDNIFLAVTPRGVVPKVIDFGIAKVIASDPEAVQRTLAGVLLGSPFYMSPEQVLGDPTIDQRADVWSLGVVLYEMLAGRRPFPAAKPSMMLWKILNEDPTPLDVVAPDVPADLAAVVMAALRRDRNARHPTMQAFLDAVRACAEAPTSVAPEADAPTPSSRGARASGPTARGEGWAWDPSAASEDPPSSFPRAAAPRRSARDLAVAGVIALAFGVAGAVAGVVSVAHDQEAAARAVPPPVTRVAVPAPPADEASPAPSAAEDAGAPSAIGGGRREADRGTRRARRAR